MERNDHYSAEQQKTKLLTGMGCLFGFLIIGLLVIILIAWYPTKIVYQILFPEETQLIVSYAPNHTNKIEIVEMDDFPKPPPKIRIKYKDTYIEPSMNTNIRREFRSENISVTWENNVEATVVIRVGGHEPIITEIKFE